MERRLLTFFIASTAFLLLYVSLQKLVGPQPPLRVAPVAENDADGDNAAQGLLADSENPDSPSDQMTDLAGDGDAEGTDTAAVRPQSGKWITLGSMDPKSEYLMLMTLNSKGGGIERLELTQRDDKGRLKYHRVDVRSGYLGYLAASPAAKLDGVRVNVVGPGTPADLAGLKVDDIIVSVNKQPVLSRKAIDDELLETKPGDVVKLEIVRGDVSKPIDLQATLSEHPLDLVRLAGDAGIDQVDGNLTRQSCLMTLAQINRKTIPVGKLSIPNLVDPTDLVWESSDLKSETDQESENVSEGVEFTLELSASETKSVGGAPVRLKRSYAITPGSYVVDMDVQVDNLGDQEQDLAIRLEGANGLTLEGWWYSNKISPNWSGAAARDIIYRTTADGHQLVSGYNLLKRARKEVDDPYQTIFAPDADKAAKNLKYIGVDAQYFTVGYIPIQDKDAFTNFGRAAVGLVVDPDEVPRHKERAVNASFFLDTTTVGVPAGGSMRQNLRMFAGPKRPELLQQYGLGDAVYYGWFAWFASLLAGLLHVLAGWFGNYALAIIVLTVIVRGAMFPLSRKAAVNAQKMQELAPELKKIADQHKDDIQARMTAQRELQKRVGFNPMAGCLPMFLQLPIFIGLYRALSVDIELRQQPLIPGMDWASNLAGPDMFRYWGDWMIDYLAGRGTGWLGPYFNILPVIVVGLFLLQQKLFMPPATDEQTAMTQKMMSIMTLMMGLFFFRVPAGLCLYFITSSLWGICERVLVKKTVPNKTHFDLATPAGGVIEGTAKPTPKEKGSLAQRIKEQVNGPEPKFERPNKRKKPKKK